MSDNSNQSKSNGFKRRGVLKLIGIGAVAASGTGTEEVRATHTSDCYEVTAYLSVKTYNETGDYTARDYALREMAGVMVETSGECMATFFPEQLISPPTEIAEHDNKITSACHPCDPRCNFGKNFEFDSLLDWWDERTSCPGDKEIKLAADSTLLVTGRTRDDNKVSGEAFVGESAPHIGVIDAGLWITDWDGTYEQFTASGTLEDLSVALVAHEMGHNFQTDPLVNPDYDDEHGVSEAINNNGTFFKTVMNTGYNYHPYTNECQEDQEAVDGIAHLYSDCATSVWRDSEYEGNEHDSGGPCLLCLIE